MNCFLLIISAILIFQSCDLKEEPIPSYVFINQFSLSCDLASQGFNSSKIVDAWVYANGIFVGVFEIPSTVPIIATGETELSILPGIKDNGISGTGTNYPFYKAYTTTLNLTAGQTDTISPSTTYITAIDFLGLDRFESSNLFSTSSLSDTSWIATSDASIVFEGAQSAGVIMDNAHPNFIGISPYFSPPTNGGFLYIEMDYTSNTNIDVWITAIILGNIQSTNKLTITPKDYWNKIYINISNDVRQLGADSYRIELRATKPSDEDGAFFIDNFKLIEAL